MSPDQTTTVLLDKTIASLERVHAGLDEVWQRYPWVSSLDRMAVETAVVELASNVIRHSLKEQGSRAELALAVGDQELRAQIIDDGGEFSGDLDHVQMPGLDAESGRGLAVIDMLMDVFEYRRQSSHNRWTLIRRLKPETATR